jgi:fermentation-respiration switch protein FrsA (DUF1100 family)
VLFEEKFIYFPTKYPDGLWDVSQIETDEGKPIPEVEDCWFRAEDGVRLHGWYCSPSPKDAGRVASQSGGMNVLFFHGNAGNITHRIDLVVGLMEIPVDVLIVDYRGYGKSEGRPSEQGLYMDGRAAWDFLVAERGVNPERIVLFGKSLGGAVAIDLATHIEPAGLIVQSSFTSIPDMAKQMIPFLPGVLIRTRMDSISKIPGIRCPKLFIHSPADEIVPYRFGRRLFDAASEPKQFFEVPDAPHNETYRVGGEAYLKVLQGFVASCESTQKDSSAKPYGGR